MNVTTALRPALFFDRDGVVNVDHGYCHRIEDFQWIPGIFETIRLARDLGLATVVVTNQAGIGRGLYTETQFAELTEWMKARFVAMGAPLEAVYHCPFHPDGVPPYNVESPLRKPAPGMLLKAALDLGLDLAASVMVGDRESDIEAGRRAGVRRTALFCTGEVPATEADAILIGHGQARAWISATFGATPDGDPRPTAA